MLRKAINLLLYSNLLIAAAATCLVWSTEMMSYGQVSMSPYHWFVFGGSLFIYSAHRLIGIHKYDAYKIDRRHGLIMQMEWLVVSLAVLGLVIAFFMVFGLSQMQQTLLLMPVAVSLAYIVPFTRKGLRLRDYPFVKVFLIALVWAWLAVIVPLWDSRPVGIWWLFMERFFYILSITLPFDVRDLDFDRQQGTKTIPGLLGVKPTQQLAYMFLGAAAVMGVSYLIILSFATKVLAGYVMSLLITLYFLTKVNEEKPDYLFTGWLDGTMIIQYLCLLLSARFF